MVERKVTHRTALATVITALAVGTAGAYEEFAAPKALGETRVLFLASGLMYHATGCTIDINAASYVR